ncbi:hypothetical protein J6590_091193 [Homalodisca vitripennis]|nr:hypothetical protein J6590_091193 [Homalodisca vitripennis]
MLKADKEIEDETKKKIVRRRRAKKTKKMNNTCQENFKEDINDYEEEFWDDSDWEPFCEESDESENEFSSIKRSNKRKATRQLFAPSSKKVTILTGQSNNPLPLAYQSNTQDSSSSGRKENQNTNITYLPEVDCTNTNYKRKQSVCVLKTCPGKKGVFLLKIGKV